MGTYSPRMSSRRLFLDTGVLHRLADGKLSAPLVEELHEAIRFGGAQLVLTHELMHDALSAVDQPTRERFANAIRRFEPFLFVRSPPHAVEPLGGAVQDIPLVEITGLLEAIGDWPPPWFDPATLLTDKLFAGIKASVAVFREDPTASFPIKQKHFDHIQPALMALMGSNAGDATAVPGPPPAGDDLSERERQAVDARIKAAAAFLAETGFDETFADDFRRHQQLDFDPLSSPGRAILEALTAEGKRDLGREPKRSDIADTLHASHFPYVDIATCDAYVFSVLSKAAFGPLLRFPRTPKLVRNGDIQHLIAALRALAP